MKRRVWLGGLVLSLGGWNVRVHADDPAWHSSAPRPLPAAVTGAEVPAGPVAVIGRPVVIATSRPVPPASAGSLEVTPVSFQTPADPSVVTPPVPPGPPPVWPNEADDAVEQADLIGQVSQFASDRGAAVRVVTAAEVTQAGGPVLDGIEQAPAPAPTVDKSAVKLPIPPALPAPPVYPAAVDGPMPDPLHCHYWVKGEYLLWGVRSTTFRRWLRPGRPRTPFRGARPTAHANSVRQFGPRRRSAVWLPSDGWRLAGHVGRGRHRGERLLPRRQDESV